jgi:hypothetical protein
MSDGTSVESDSSDIDRVLSAFFRRDVRLAGAAPEDFAIDQYHPTSDIDPAGCRDSRRTEAWLSLFSQAGLASPYQSVHSLTCSSVRANNLHPREAE